MYDYLQQAFMQFVTNQITQKQPAKTSVIEEISSDIYEALSDLSFDEETLSDYVDYDDYHYDEGFGENEIAQMVTEVLEPYQKRVDVYMTEGRLIDVMNVWLGVYEGILAATEPQEDDYGMIADYVEHNQGVWLSLTKNAIEIAKKRPFTTYAIKQAIDLLIERYFTLEKDTKNEQFYTLKDFEPLLIAVVSDAESATYLKEIFEKYDLVDTPTVYVLLHVAQITKDDRYWEKLSQDFAKFDAKITQNLLDFYQENNQTTNFISQAEALFEIQKNEIDKLIFSYLTYEQAPELYKKALRNYCLRKKNIATYKKLRPYLSEEEIAGIVGVEKASYSLNLFCVELLEVEEQYPDILRYIRQDNRWLDARMQSVLEIATKYYPNETLELVRKHTWASLATGQRGRTIYSLIASWLAAMKTNPDIVPDVNDFIKELIGQFNRLPALKDELKSKGLKF